ncbi:MAG: hypothetical protein U1E05_04715 [Patescibacteria group bacterium]|nr:hypothetical protein [Patescibacteria group bacterium]
MKHGRNTDGQDAAILRDENTDTDGLCDDGRVYYLTDESYSTEAPMK